MMGSIFGYLRDSFGSGTARDVKSTSTLSPNISTASNNRQRAMDTSDRSLPHADAPAEMRSLPGCSTAPEISNDIGADATLNKVKSSMLYSYRSLVSHRHQCMKVRVEAQMSITHYVHLRSSARRTQRRLNELLQLAKATGDWDRYTDDLCSWSAKLETDFLALEAHVPKSQSIQGRLGTLECQAREQETHFFQALSAWLRSSGLDVPSPFEGYTELDARSAQDHASNSSLLDPLMAAYYDLVGNIGVTGERLANVDIEYQERASMRRLKVEQERSLSVTESVFDDYYAKLRASTKRELQATLVAARKARRACDEAGLDINRGSERSASLITEYQGRTSDNDELFRLSPELGPSEAIIGQGASGLTEAMLHDRSLRSNIEDLKDDPVHFEDRMLDQQRIIAWTDHLVLSEPEAPIDPIFEDSNEPIVTQHCSDTAIRAPTLMEVNKMPDFSDELQRFVAVRRPRRNSSPSNMLRKDITNVIQYTRSLQDSARSTEHKSLEDLSEAAIDDDNGIG